MVAGGRPSVCNGTFGLPTMEHRHRGGPGRITRRPGTGNAPRETHPRGSDVQRVEIGRTPWRPTAHDRPDGVSVEGRGDTAVRLPNLLRQTLELGQVLLPVCDLLPPARDVDTE